MLHALERRGCLRSREKRIGRTARRLYRTTAKGSAALEDAKEKLKELVGELMEGADCHPGISTRRLGVAAFLRH